MKKVTTNWDEILPLIPGYDPFAQIGDSQFVPEEADRAVKFIEGYCRHQKGKWAGETIKLEPWQRAIVGNLFGWLRPATPRWVRRYRSTLIFVPRKNAKTTLSAALANYMLFADAEKGAEVYCCASDEEQAFLLFSVAKGMVEDDPKLLKRADVMTRRIVLKNSTSFFRVISSKASTKHGFNTHCAIIDELHAHLNRELFDVLTTSTGSREQPLMVYITTSDYERENSICNEQHAYACQVRDGIVPSTSFLPVIYEAQREDDWTDEAVWEMANPNLDVSVSREYLREECNKAKANPAYENTFRRLFLNIRTEAAARWLKLEEWDACEDEYTEEDLRGRRCFAGLDLASTRDLCALVLMFPGRRHDDGTVDRRRHILSYFWCPEEEVKEAERTGRSAYATWVRQGLLTATPGAMTDYRAIKEQIRRLAKQFRIQEIAFDRWNATQIVTELSDEGFEMVQFGQGIGSMSAPCKELEGLLASRRLRHNGHPVMRWMISNVTKKEDEGGNIKPLRTSDKLAKVDGVFALAMALGRLMVGEPQEKENCLDRRGGLIEL